MDAEKQVARWALESQLEPIAKDDSGIRVLVVDDSADILYLMSILLTRMGYKVATAQTVSDALELASAACFDVIVSDIGLPDGNGVDLVRRIKQSQDAVGIAISGWSVEDLGDQKELDRVFTAYLLKPVDPNVLNRVICDAAQIKD